MNNPNEERLVPVSGEELKEVVHKWRDEAIEKEMQRVISVAKIMHLTREWTWESVVVKIDEKPAKEFKKYKKAFDQTWDQLDKVGI